MGYTIKQKIDICLKAESNPEMTQADLANWAKTQYKSLKAPSQTTISRILSSKNDLIASKETEFQLVRRRKQSNPLLRRILTEWVTQASWESIPVTTPIIQSTANAIWNRLPTNEKDGSGIFNQKWCNHFIKKLNINLTGNEEDIRNNPGHYKLNKIWKLDEKIELKEYLAELNKKENYSPQDIFTIDEFQLFYSLPLDQIFDVSSIDKGLKQSSSSTENSLTIMLGCNIDGSEKLNPLVVGKYDKFDVSKSSHSSFKNLSSGSISQHNLMNKITEAYQLFYKSNTNKWITSSMFQNYLLTLEHKLSNVSPNRKILILLDDSSSHRIINLKFSNIRLCYLKNNNNHKNPYNSSYNGAIFDYLPMNFGIIEEFKILYRLQQYLEMINLQRINSKSHNSESSTPLDIDISNYMNTSAPSAMEVLSENDFHIPLIKVIEWIKRSWDSISPEKIFLSWKKTHLINFNIQWPASDPLVARKASESLVPIISKSSKYNSSKSYDKLVEIMGFLNVVIPWEVDDLLGLVNERGKITLSYVSIEEIIGSCLSESYNKDGSEDYKYSNSIQNETLINDNSWFNNPPDNNSPSNSLLNPPLTTVTNTSALTNKSPNDTTQFSQIDMPYSEFSNTTNSATSNNSSTILVVPSINSTKNSTINDTTNNINSNSLIESHQSNQYSLAGTSITNIVNNTKINDPLNSLTSLPPILSKFSSNVTPSTTILTTSLINSLGNDVTPRPSKHKLDSSDSWISDRKRHLLFSPSNTSASPNFPFLTNTSNQVSPLNDPLPASASPLPYTSANGSDPENCLSKPGLTGTNYKSSLNANSSTFNDSERNINDYELMKLLSRLIEIYTNTNCLRLSNNTIHDLRMSLKEVQERLDNKSRE